MSNAHKEVVKTYFKAMGAGDVELFKSTITEDYRAVIAGYSKISGTMDRDAVLAFVEGVPSMTRSGISFEIRCLTAEEDRVASESLGRSVMVNGAEYNNQYIHLFRFHDGRIRQVTEYMDTQLAEKTLLPLMSH
ncbi:nuclear transport factor 2 family protein [Streptomyces sp. NPDC005799]|uniref:nuclear transport factor 2 family protein n=1 Tax=Streptomyces sp. NPDC005799 TaxID=3154678 RepID=UPI0033ED645D